MGKRTRMTQQIYTTVKFMLKGGATAEEINAVHPISRETMRRIIRTENFDEYRALQEKYSKQSFENRIAKPEQLTMPVEMIPIPAHDPVDTVISEIMREQTALLRELLEKVAFIVKDLTGKEA